MAAVHQHVVLEAIERGGGDVAAPDLPLAILEGHLLEHGGVVILVPIDTRLFLSPLLEQRLVVVEHHAVDVHGHGEAEIGPRNDKALPLEVDEVVDVRLLPIFNQLVVVVELPLRRELPVVVAPREDDVWPQTSHHGRDGLLHVAVVTHGVDSHVGVALAELVDGPGGQPLIRIWALGLPEQLGRLLSGGLRPAFGRLGRAAAGRRQQRGTGRASRSDGNEPPP